MKDNLEGEMRSDETAGLIDRRGFLQATLAGTALLAVGGYSLARPLHSPPSKEAKRFESIITENELESLVKVVFDPKKGENVVLLNDYPSDEKDVDADYICREVMTEQWKEAFEKVAKERGFTVEDIITYEPTHKNNGNLPRYAVQSARKIDLTKKLDSLGEKDIVVGITRFSPTAPLKYRIDKGGQRYRAATMPGGHMKMEAFKADYAFVAKKAHVLQKAIEAAAYAEVIFSTGHRMRYDLRGRAGEADDGDCRTPGRFTNLPAGEAYAPPYEGFDKALGKSMTSGEIPVSYDGVIVIFEVKEGRIRNVRPYAESPSLSASTSKAAEMKAFFEEDPGRSYIAELGLGCNDKAVPIGNVLQDEKVEGMHWAYGKNAHFEGGMIDNDKFRSDNNVIHIDIVYGNKMPLGIRQITMHNTDGTRSVIMKDNQYTLDFGR